jgi:hypothetical protein
VINICSTCNKPLDDGNEIKFVATGVYHTIPSTKSWALERGSLEADVESLAHVVCPKGD